jgi:SNF2 family DNA or RNA helicase
MTTAERQLVHTTFTTFSKKGRPIQEKALLRFEKGRIFFDKSPYSLKGEIKAMKGSKWHGFDADPKKIWSVEDCFRNRFQLSYLERGDVVYEWFDRPDKQFEFKRPLKWYQREDANHWLTVHFGIEAAAMGVGKTLMAIEVIENSGVKEWWYVAPKKPCVETEREFRKWALDPSINVELMTYEAMTRRMDNWSKNEPLPQGVIFDESSLLKTDGRQRTQAAQFLADNIRAKYGYDGFVLLMSGTPSPKSPVDWWAQCEIAFPGFVKEGSERAFKARMAIMAQREYAAGGGVHNELIAWKDDEKKCNLCGQYKDAIDHDKEDADPDAFHAFEPSVNEVAELYQRLEGLVRVRSKDILELPPKKYRKIYCKPSQSTLRVAQALVNSSLNAVTAMTLLRELSDGFQYREKSDGYIKCPTCEDGEVKEWFDPGDPERIYSSVDMLDPTVVENLQEHMVTCYRCNGAKEISKTVRTALEVPCPKEDALVETLKEQEQRGRIVVAAGFTGSVDRCMSICLREGWDVVRCDGRGFNVFTKDGKAKVTKPLDYWADLTNKRVAFVCHPESGGMGFNLTEACVIFVWSNSYKPQYRTQLEDRIYRLGLDEEAGATIIDCLHLPTDEKTLTTIREDRRLELLTMGEVAKAFEDTPND